MSAYWLIVIVPCSFMAGCLIVTLSVLQLLHMIDESNNPPGWDKTKWFWQKKL